MWEVGTEASCRGPCEALASDSGIPAELEPGRSCWKPQRTPHPPSPPTQGHGVSACLYPPPLPCTLEGSLGTEEWQVQRKQRGEISGAGQRM